ncbi:MULTISPECIES: hypothetical protein [Mycolicibacterium]|uniref:Serine/threonine protein kinase n=5 Tax=Mycolicibacterium TaxID=1866885 RepID=A0A378T258_9MYCO|nr:MULTISPECIES: hypothetical protein [Mycolicibacterium]MCV7334817.1 hypothetical protein [Mycolicibacterium senegalense]MCW1821019.1 hypothetical protein [Mycolicibacterium senegalense]MDR7290203.1 hypothetical protein [Mycolicibacterium senegalense]QZA26943.1 hypothetical protein K3U95_13475 [Mycolicibacterium senegalense]QZH59328.1 hypothetical protein K1X22_24505 [Mycolicibacterium farcinogenes]
MAAAAVVSSMLTAFVILTTLTSKFSARDSVYAVGARTYEVKPNRPLQRTFTARAATPPVAAFASDGSGFVDSSARCADTQTARAIGRTEGSLVVICLDRTGRLEYHGVRLSDKAALAASADLTPGRKFVARNYQVNYAVSPTELLVTSGNAVLKREPMVEYREILSTPVVVAPR